jgi:hypothetical protein
MNHRVTTICIWGTLISPEQKMSQRDVSTKAIDVARGSKVRKCEVRGSGAAAEGASRPADPQAQSLAYILQFASPGRGSV